MTNVPCPRPNACGVTSHRAGSESARLCAMKDPARLTTGLTESMASRMPSHSRSGDAAVETRTELTTRDIQSFLERNLDVKVVSKLKALSNGLRSNWHADDKKPGRYNLIADDPSSSERSRVQLGVLDAGMTPSGHLRSERQWDCDIDLVGLWDEVERMQTGERESIPPFEEVSDFLSDTMDRKLVEKMNDKIANGEASWIQDPGVWGTFHVIKNDGYGHPTRTMIPLVTIYTADHPSGEVRPRNRWDFEVNDREL